MKTFKSIIVAACALAAACAFAEKQPIERYQSIIDRQMFGPLPKDFDPTKMPSEVARSSSAEERELTKEQEQLQSAIHFSVINVDHDGTAVVGFTDNSDPKAPVHYYMKVGETQNGWFVKEANPENATMTIVKGEVEVSLTLGDNSGQGGGKTAAANANGGGAAGGDAPAMRPGRGLLGGSLSARRAMRRQAAAEAAEAAEQKRAAEAAEKEAARQAQAEQEKQEREQERAQQRQQLLAIQEELRKAREEKERQRAAEGGNDGNDPQ